MNPQILTLFGEEYAPQPAKPARGRAKRKDPAEEKAEEQSESESKSEGEPLIERESVAESQQSQEVLPEAIAPVPEVVAEAAPEEKRMPETEQAGSAAPGVMPAAEAVQEHIVPPPVQEPEVVYDSQPVKAPAARAEEKKKATRVRKTPIKKRIIQPRTDLLKGWVPVKQYYTIGEVSRLFDVNTSHIRFWTNEFALKVRTTKKGDRLYTPAQIQELHTIYDLVKVRGFTLAGAKAKLKEDKKEAAEKQQIKQSLLKLKNRLKAMRQQLA